MPRTYTLTIEGRTAEVQVWEEGGKVFASIGESVHEVSLGKIGDGRLYALLVDGRSYEVYARRTATGYELLVGSELYGVEVERGRRRGPRAGARAASNLRSLRSPMAGIVASLYVEAGQTVERGTVLLVLESMKMNNELRAERAATVERVAVRVGQRVERGSLLLELRPSDGQGKGDVDRSLNPA